MAYTGIPHASDWQGGSFNAAIEMLTSACGTDEFREGMTAFLQKRKTDFHPFWRCSSSRLSSEAPALTKE
jgi:1,4-dihydroxy-2-naphthoyl-CoA synthase